jgi:site-specific recombinase XerD
MAKIINKNYRAFIDKGIIQTLDQEDITKALGNVAGRYTKEGRALIIILYYTGARPNEVLQIKAKDIHKEGSYLVINLKGSKGGLPRPVYLPLKLDMVKELYNYSKGHFEDMLLFSHFAGEYTRVYITKKGQAIQYVELTGKLRYYFARWFANVIEGSISPYFLRHNRFSALASKGLTLEDLRQIKGAKTFSSIYPYLHLSVNTAKKIAKKIN